MCRRECGTGLRMLIHHRECPAAQGVKKGHQEFYWVARHHQIKKDVLCRFRFFTPGLKAQHQSWDLSIIPIMLNIYNSKVCQVFKIGTQLLEYAVFVSAPNALFSIPWLLSFLKLPPKMHLTLNQAHTVHWTDFLA